MDKVAIVVLMLFGTTASAATMYISDYLTVPLRRGPSTDYRIINAALPSGMALEVLGEDRVSGFTKVRTPSGTEGWVPTQYLVNEPSAKDRLAAATKRVQALEAENQKLQQQVTELSAGVEQLRRNIELRWMLGGGGLVLIGLIFGAWIKSRPRRSGWA